jgi:hypothetical protein
LFAAAACHASDAVTDAGVHPDSSVVCFPGQPGDLLREACADVHAPRTLGDLVVDTDIDAPMCELDFKSPYCMISGTTITILPGTTVSAVGSRPLVLVALDSIDVEGTIDVSSHRDATEVIGSAADDPRCAAGDGLADAAGGTGGAGGALQFAGGAGGAVGSSPGGSVAPGLTTADLHGGCRGGAGGSFFSVGGGARGHSGGAVYLIAPSTITLGATARILANGEGGGKGGSGGGGGGGGGSGGLIGIDAPTIQLANGALLLAEGGGGGGGDDLAANARDGADAAATTAATGGTATAPAGSGGDGSLGGNGQAGQPGPPAPTSSTGGGGGGGGASGYVLLYGAVVGSARISPPPGS